METFALWTKCAPFAASGGDGKPENIQTESLGRHFEHFCGQGREMLKWSFRTKGCGVKCLKAKVSGKMVMLPASPEGSGIKLHLSSRCVKKVF